MIWGGLTELVFMEWRQSSADCMKVLEDDSLLVGESYHGRNVIFQQDYDPIHTFKLTKTFFQFESYKLSSLFSHWNPIEHFWGMLSRLVYNNGKQVHSKSDLENAIRRAWKDPDGNFLKTLIKSLDNRKHSY